jgi:hypothetical protein
MHRLSVSTPNDEGHVLIARISPGTRVVVTYDDTHEPQDITEWVADLALVGMAVQYERNTNQTLPPTNIVKMGRVSVVGAGEPPTFLYAHPLTGTASEYGWAVAAEVVALGVARQITAGVAFEVAAEELPDTPVPN